jgi:hypothetical protein
VPPHSAYDHKKNKEIREETRLYKMTIFSGAARVGGENNVFRI